MFCSPSLSFHFSRFTFPGFQTLTGSTLLRIPDQCPFWIPLISVFFFFFLFVYSFQDFQRRIYLCFQWVSKQEYEVLIMTVDVVSQDSDDSDMCNTISLQQHALLILWSCFHLLVPFWRWSKVDARVCAHEAGHSHRPLHSISSKSLILLSGFKIKLSYIMKRR